MLSWVMALIGFHRPVYDEKDVARRQEEAADAELWAMCEGGLESSAYLRQQAILRKRQAAALAGHQ